MAADKTCASLAACLTVNAFIIEAIKECAYVATHMKLKSGNPALHTEQFVAFEHVLQLEEQALHVILKVWPKKLSGHKSKHVKTLWSH